MRRLEVRRALEDVVVRKAALNATPNQRLLVAETCRNLLRIVNSGREWHKADAEFHGAVYEASGNPLFGQLLANLDDALERSAESPFGRTEFGLPSFPLHQILCDGVVNADPEVAARGINAIIDSVSEEISLLIAAD